MKSLSRQESQRVTVEIVEVLRRSEQGMTKPFICRGDDGEIYFVKGIGATRRGQICEWIAGKLGLALGIPVAPFTIVEIPEDLLDLDVGLDLTDLGAGPAFGSLRQEVMELTASTAMEVPEPVQQDVLAFDWWIRNGDRSLTEKGGNPNLFWEPGHRQLVVIDHNQAFDSDFDAKEFLGYHVFSGQQIKVFGDMLRTVEYNQRFLSALDDWHDICHSLPEAWKYSDLEMTIPVDFDLEAAYELLKSCEREDFWTTP